MVGTRTEWPSKIWTCLVFEPPLHLDYHCTESTKYLSTEGAGIPIFRFEENSGHLSKTIGNLNKMVAILFILLIVRIWNGRDQLFQNWIIWNLSFKTFGTPTFVIQALIVFLPGVCLKKMSENATSCSVLPKPIECARMQPKPFECSKRDGDSMILSNKNRTPPTWKSDFMKFFISQTF